MFNKMPSQNRSTQTLQTDYVDLLNSGTFLLIISSVKDSVLEKKNHS